LRQLIAELFLELSDPLLESSQRLVDGLAVAPPRRLARTEAPLTQQQRLGLVLQLPTSVR
jgi:hypothetical protein